jgi:hypothetical protein
MTNITIALCGLAGVGKDTVADTLVTHAGFTKMAFADALRREVAAAFRLGGYEHILSDRPNKERPQALLALCQCTDAAFVELVAAHEQTPSHYEFMRRFRSPRQILQLWGTEYRRTQQPDYWSGRAVHRIDAMRASGRERIVITDCRFANEAATVRKLGGEVWQVVRPGAAIVEGGHASQNDGTNLQPDLALYNGQSINDLRHSTLRALVLRHGGLVLPDDLEGATA